MDAKACLGYQRGELSSYIGYTYDNLYMLSHIICWIVSNEKMSVLKELAMNILKKYT